MFGAHSSQNPFRHKKEEIKPIKKVKFRFETETHIVVKNGQSRKDAPAHGDTT